MRLNANNINLPLACDYHDDIKEGVKVTSTTTTIDAADASSATDQHVRTTDEEHTSGNEVFRILSIDGGGVRGIIPATVLSYIESKTGKRINALFDLIVGTSTGSIISVALTIPDPKNPTQPRYTADDLIKLYETESKTIFHRSLIDNLRSGWGWLDERYNTEGIDCVLKKYLTDPRTKQSHRLKNLLNDVVVTAYDITLRESFFFKSRRAREHPELHDYSAFEVLRSSTAAPTYFHPYKIEGHDAPPGKYRCLVDGGVFANNPAMCGYVESIKHHKANAKNVILCSLGTGNPEQSFSYEQACGWGLVGWSRPLINIMFDGVSDSVEYQLQQLLSPEHYYRYETTVAEKHSDFDDASDDNIAYLKKRGQELVEERRADLDKMCAQLVSKTNKKRSLVPPLQHAIDECDDDQWVML